MNDGRDKVRVDDKTFKRIVFVCTMSGRRAADVRAEALRIGAEVLEIQYKDGVGMEPSGLIQDETSARKPNRQERRAAASRARKSPAKKTRGKKVVKRKTSASA